MFGAGKNLYRGPNHHYGLNICNDPAQSPIAGKVKVHGSPGEGKTIGVTHVYFLSSANRDKEWAWKLLQYLGGKTKDGNYTQAVGLAKDAMLGSGYTSEMNSDAVKLGWAPWGDVPAMGTDKVRISPGVREEYRDVPKLLAEVGQQPLFLDGRRMLDKLEFSRYVGVGAGA